MHDDEFARERSELGQLATEPNIFWGGIFGDARLPSSSSKERRGPSYWPKTWRVSMKTRSTGCSSLCPTTVSISASSQI